MDAERRGEAWGGGQRGEERKQETEAKIILFPPPIEDTRLSPGNRSLEAEFFCILFLTEMGLMGGRGAVPGADRDPLTGWGNGIVDKAVICRSQTHAAAATCHRARPHWLLGAGRDRRPSNLQPNQLK